MSVHVLTAFLRPQYLSVLIPMLEAQNVIWHPIYMLEEYEKSFDIDWIQPFVIPKPPPGMDPTYWKYNRWLDSQKIIDDDLYCFLGDDDAYLSGFFDAVRNILFDEVLVVSQHCYQWLRTAAQENMKVGSINSGQYILKGKVAKLMRFHNCYWADGAVAEWLVKYFLCVYHPELIVLYNRLQPGYWPTLFQINETPEDWPRWHIFPLPILNCQPSMSIPSIPIPDATSVGLTLTT